MPEQQPQRNLNIIIHSAAIQQQESGIPPHPVDGVHVRAAAEQGRQHRRFTGLLFFPLPEYTPLSPAFLIAAGGKQRRQPFGILRIDVKSAVDQKINDLTASGLYQQLHRPRPPGGEQLRRLPCDKPEHFRVTSVPHCGGQLFQAERFGIRTTPGQKPHHIGSVAPQRRHQPGMKQLPPFLRRTDLRRHLPQSANRFQIRVAAIPLEITPKRPLRPFRSQFPIRFRQQPEQLGAAAPQGGVEHRRQPQALLAERPGTD